MRGIELIAVALLVTGCYSPQARDCAYRCAGMVCPTGLSCEQGFCREPAFVGACNPAGDDAPIDIDAAECGWSYEVANIDACSLPAITMDWTVTGATNQIITLDTNSGTVSSGQPPPFTDLRSQRLGPPQVRLMVARNFTVANTITLKVVGTYALVVIAQGDVNVVGTIDASANGTTTPGYDALLCPAGLGKNFVQAVGNPGGGGGGFGTAGASGADADGPPANNGGPGGAVEGEPTLRPLRGGCGGGVGGGGHGGGVGGGAVQVSAFGSLTVKGAGTVKAAGGGGSNGEGGGGGGTGGAILLEGTSIVLEAGAKLCANGGGGGGVNNATVAQTGTCALTRASGGGQGGGNGGAEGLPPTGGGYITGDGGGGGGAVGRIRLNGAVTNNTTIVTPMYTTP